MGENADIYISDTQKCLREVVEGEKYKKHSIDYWLNEVFWCFWNRAEEASLRTKLNLDEEITIRDLLEKPGIKARGRNLMGTNVPDFAEQCLQEEYRKDFFDFLNYDYVHYLSVDDFLELLRRFEKSRIRKG